MRVTRAHSAQLRVGRKAKKCWVHDDAGCVLPGFLCCVALGCLLIGKISKPGVIARIINLGRQRLEDLLRRSEEDLESDHVSNKHL